MLLLLLLLLCARILLLLLVVMQLQLLLLGLQRLVRTPSSTMSQCRWLPSCLLKGHCRSLPPPTLPQ